MMRKHACRSIVWLFAVTAGLAGCERTLPSGPEPDLARAEQIRAALISGESLGGGEKEAADLGEGWGTLRGSFKLAAGAPIPERRPLDVNKDVAVCAPGGKTVLSRAIVVDEATRGIANVAVYVRDAPRVHPEIAEMPGEPAIFDQKACIFLTRVMAVRTNRTIRLLNSDPVGHNTNISTIKTPSINTLIPSGSESTFTPIGEENTPVSVTCNIHPWMQAYLLPRENGYFTVTADDGSFEIPNLPAGVELEFQVWHESASGSGGGLPVDNPPGGIPWSSKGRFRITLAPDEATPLEVSVPTSSFRL